MNTRLTSSLILLTTFAAQAQVDLQPPSFGCHIAGTGRVLRLLSGVRNAVSATRLERGIEAAACAGNRLLYYTNSEVILLQGTARTTHPIEGRLLLALDDSLAVAINTTDGSVLFHQGGEWSASPLRLSPGIRAIRLTAGRLWTLDSTALSKWDPATGALLQSHSLAVPDGPAVLLTDHSVLAIAGGDWLHCIPQACTALDSAPGSAPTLSLLSGDWVAVNTATGLPRAVRLHAGALESFFLPGESAE
jgi:hypothetical protein